MKFFWSLFSNTIIWRIVPKKWNQIKSIFNEKIGKALNCYDYFLDLNWSQFRIQFYYSQKLLFWDNSPTRLSHESIHNIWEYLILRFLRDADIQIRLGWDSKLTLDCLHWDQYIMRFDRRGFEWKITYNYKWMTLEQWHIWKPIEIWRNSWCAESADRISCLE